MTYQGMPFFLTHGNRTRHTFLDAWESEQFHKTKVISSDDGLVVKGGVCGVDVVDLGVLWPDPIDL